LRTRGRHWRSAWTAGRSLRGKARQMDSKTQGRRRAPRIVVLLLALVTTLCAGLIGSAPAQAAPPEPSALSGNVTGTLQDGTGKVTGLINVTKFKKQDGKLMAVGK